MIKKQYLKSRPVCKVTFAVEAGKGVESVALVGDFNNWTATPMEAQKGGRFKTMLELEQGRDYQFRYLIDENEWRNEEQADNYVGNPFNGENSVVSI